MEGVSYGCAGAIAGLGTQIGDIPRWQ